jgi:hypothetical protein
MKMRNKLAATILSLAFASSVVGCTTYSAIAVAPENKVFVTKTTSYIIWAVNKMEICDYAAGKASNCTEVTQD